MKILFLESDQIQEYNCSNWRCHMPARALNRAGQQAKIIRTEEWIARTPNAVQLTEQADIVILQRNMFMDAFMNTTYWKTLNKPIAVDLDDSYKDMTPETGSPSVKFWKDGIITQKQPDGTDKDITVHPHPLFVLRNGIKLAGALTSPSQLIVEDWKPYVKSYWFPNYIDLSMYRRYPVYKEPGQIRIGWGGSMTHLVSWTNSGAQEAMSQIMKEFPNVYLLLMGDVRTERFFKDIPQSRRIAIGYVPHAIFAMKLSLLDIGLIPLYGEYDRRRSWLKTAEYSVMGIPWVGTDSEPTQSIDTGTRVKNTPEDWYNAIKSYITNIDTIKETAERNIPASQEFFDIDRHTNDLIKTFEQIIGDQS